MLAAELMVVVYASFSLRTRIGDPELAPPALGDLPASSRFATLHGLAAGTDSGTTWALALYGGATGAVLAATAWRALVPPEKGDTRVSHRDRSLAL